MWYVNNVLCFNEKRRDELKFFYFSIGQDVEVREAPRDEYGRWITPINDPMEQ
jgi:hypothetical protein